jgi:RNA polymerase sigma-70 factor, ECF subfamily
MDTSLTWLQKLTKSPTGDDWRHLLEAYSPLLMRWIARAGIPASDRDDLVQEVLIVVARRVHEFERQHAGAFRGWLRAILANQIKKYFREHPGPVCLFPLEEVCNPASALSAQFDREHDEYFAARAMRIVKVDFEPTTWRAFELQVLEGRSPKVVAESLQITLNAVIKAKSRVLKRLRQELSRIVE